MNNVKEIKPGRQCQWRRGGEVFELFCINAFLRLTETHKMKNDVVHIMHWYKHTAEAGKLVTRPSRGAF